MFDTVLLRSFVAVVQENGFTRAAERLCLTQSAISTHLKRLEEHVGKPLIYRATRSVVLTLEGEILMAYARAILALNRDAEAHLSGAAVTETVRIGLSGDIANLRLMQTLQDFCARNPRVAIEVKVGIPAVLLNAMDLGNLDLVIGGRCQSVRQGHLLWREPLIWAFAEQSALILPDPLPLAFLAEPCPYREAAIAALALAGRSFRIVMVSPGATGLLAAARAGFALTAIPASQLESGLCSIKPEQGLPSLPNVEFMLFEPAESKKPVLIDLARTIITSISGSPVGPALKS